MKNHYEVLGLEPNASADDIKKAYRKLSLKFHPDKNQGDDYFASMFRQINEAFSVLSDTEKRRSYDQLRVRASEAERVAEALKKKERELAEREQRLRANQTNWRKSFDEVLAEPIISPRSKTDKTDSIKRKPNTQINIKTIKWSLYAVIIVLIVLIGSKDRTSTEPATVAKQYGEKTAKPHRHKRKFSKKRHKPAESASNQNGSEGDISSPAAYDTVKVDLLSPSIDTIKN